MNLPKRIGQGREQRWPSNVHWKLAGALLVPLSLLAVGPVEKTVETTPAPRISLFNPVGHVTVTGWEKSQIRIEFTTGSPQVDVDLDQLPPTGRAEKIHVTTHPLNPQMTTRDQTIDYTLEVPEGSDLEIRNSEGEIKVERIRGDASIDSVGGKIAVSNVSGHLAVRSIGGDIEVVRSAGRVEANSVNGNLRFVSPAGSQLRASTTSGKIFYEGDFLPGGNYHFSDYSGDMDILTLPSASFDLSAKTVRGKVVADPEVSVKPRRRSGSPLYGGNSLFGAHNTGAASVELTSFSGTIRIRRLQ
jgi:DUF4097 and DUF4098 domain-containing protein YvlB